MQKNKKNLQNEPKEIKLEKGCFPIMRKGGRRQTMEEKNPVQSAQRIFDVMEMLSQRGKMTLTELSERLFLHKSTVHRLLSSLGSMGYVKQDKSGKYMLTLKLLQLAGSLLEKFDIIELARPFLEALGQKTQEAVHLVQRDGAEIVYIDKVESSVSSIRMVSRIGICRPLYCTAVGKAMLAQMPRTQVAELWGQSEIIRYTEHTIVSLSALYAELDEVCERGYALDNEENELGVRCIAAALLDYKGRANAAISVSAPLSRMSDSRIKELSGILLPVATALSVELGYQKKE